VVMARNLMSVVNMLKSMGIKRPKVVAVVGMGHKPGLEHLLNTPSKMGGEFYPVW